MNGTEDGITAAQKLAAAATGDATIDGAAILRDASKAAAKLRRAPMEVKLISSTAAALGESRLEAVSNANEFGERLPSTKFILLKDMITQALCPVRIRTAGKSTVLRSPIGEYNKWLVSPARSAALGKTDGDNTPASRGNPANKASIEILIP